MQQKAPALCRGFFILKGIHNHLTSSTRIIRE